MPKSVGKFDFGYKKHVCNSWGCLDNSTRSGWSPPHEMPGYMRWTPRFIQSRLSQGSTTTDPQRRIQHQRARAAPPSRPMFKMDVSGVALWSRGGDGKIGRQVEKGGRRFFSKRKVWRLLQRLLARGTKTGHVELGRAGHELAGESV